MAINLSEEKWRRFFDDVNRRHFQWETRIEVISELTGKQILSQGLPFDGINAAEKSGTVEISVGGKIARQTHTIESPSKINFLFFTKHSKGIVEIEEKNGATTLLHFSCPPLNAENLAERDFFPIASEMTDVIVSL